MSRFSLFWVLFGLFSTQAFASLTDQEILLAPTPSLRLGERSTQIETTVETPPQRFSIGIGSGVNSFGGNIGKLYQSSGPVMELRGDWAYHPMFSLKIGGELAKYNFNAPPNGAVDISTQSLSLANRLHVLSTSLKNEGFDPYVLVQGSRLWRSQNFKDHDMVEKDAAFALTGGVGANYILDGGKLGLFAEGGVSKIFFKDRFEEQYLESGIEDTTGALYSGRIGVKVLF